MKKKIVAIMLIGMMAVSATACGSSSGGGASAESQAPEEKEYVDDITAVSSDPDSYKGKYVKFFGIVSSIDQDDSVYGYQVYTDLDYNNSVLLEVPKDLVSDSIAEGDYISADAKIDGSFDGQTVMGVDSTWAKLTAESIEKTTYVDSFGKADTTWEFSDQSATQSDVTVDITKVEFAADETRVYVTATNNSSDNIGLFGNSAKVVQNGQQYEQTFNYNVEYPSLSDEILPGASSSGVICFEKLDVSEFQFYLDGYSDNWEAEFEPFTFDLVQ